MTSLTATRAGWPLAAVYLQLLLVGATSNSWNALATTLMAELGGQARAGAAIGLNSASVFLGALVGAPLFGAVVDATNSYRVAFVALAAVTLCALIPLWFVREAGLRRHPALIV